MARRADDGDLLHRLYAAALDPGLRPELPKEVADHLGAQGGMLI